jgi:hypothetical protein
MSANAARACFQAPAGSSAEDPECAGSMHLKEPRAAPARSARADHGVSFMMPKHWALRIVTFVAASLIFPLVGMALYELAAAGTAASPVFRLTALATIVLTGLSTAAVLAAGPASDRSAGQARAARASDPS